MVPGGTATGVEPMNSENDDNQQTSRQQHAVECSAFKRHDMVNSNAMKDQGKIQYTVWFNPLKGRDVNWLHLAIQL